MCPCLRQHGCGQMTRPRWDLRADTWAAVSYSLACMLAAVTAALLGGYGRMVPNMTKRGEQLTDLWAFLREPSLCTTVP